MDHKVNVAMKATPRDAHIPFTLILTVPEPSSEETSCDEDESSEDSLGDDDLSLSAFGDFAIADSGERAGADDGVILEVKKS